MSKTPLLDSLDRFPPFLIRTMARSRGAASKRLKTASLAQRIGWPESTVRSVEAGTTWANWKLSDMEAFARGCGVNMRRLNWTKKVLKEELLRKNRFGWLSPRELKWFLDIVETLPKNHPMWGVFK